MVLDSDSISEGITNLYYTSARFDSDFSGKSTSDLSEGSNLYFTDARADARVNLQTGSNLDLSSKSTSDLSEGTNLYYTDARFDTRLATKDTDDVSEGTTNLYYTDTRSRAAVSVSGDLAYNSGTGVFSFTERTDAEVQALITAGTGVTVSGGQVSIGQAVASSDSPTFANMTLSGTGSIKVPSGTTAQRDATPANGMFRYNSEDAQFEGYADGAWGAIAGGGSGSFSTDIFAGDGSTVNFTVTSSVSDENNLMVFIDGVFQAQNSYSVSGTTLTFSTAPANGRVITVYHAKAVSIGTPSDNSVGITQLDVSDGTNGQVLTTDGAGTLSFSTVSGTTINNNADNRIITGSGTANTLNGESTLTFDGSNLNLNTTSPTLTIESGDSQDSKILFREDGSSAVSLFYEGSAGTGTSNNLHIRRELGGSETNLVTFGLDGDVGIGTDSPSSGAVGGKVLHLVNSGGTASIRVDRSDASTTGTLSITSGNGSNSIFCTGNKPLNISTNSLTRMTVDGSGNVGIGTDNPSDMLHLKSTGDASIRLESDSDNVTETDNAYIIFSQDGGLVEGYVGYGSGSNDFVLGNVFAAATSLITNNLTRLSIDAGGAVTIGGSLSKGSGSFKIDHPLPAKTDTHHLIHSFIEGPQADNIYRGKVDLVNGSATVNIDTVAGMTEGTFVALNREVQCFTTNESNWDAVKGSVSGNILTIESQNTESTATISWLVIGERQDSHMYDTEWTDDDGKVIVEPLKETATLENA